jgi:2-polyprenyl-6-methoxyphenol hydroxylase-like FAD-dependent oxidoreductase
MYRSGRAGRAVIVGGGIGGLAAAVALHRRGWQVRVLEQAPSLEAVGSGIALWPNGMRALDALGVGTAVKAVSTAQAPARIRDPSGRWLSRGDTATALERLGAVRVLHRADLLEVLRRALPPGVLVTGARAVAADPTGVAGQDLSVAYPGGAAAGDLVVGADGIHSAVRGWLFPDHPGPRYAGYTAWRLLVPPPRPGPDQAVAGETWGPGQRFGLAPLPDGGTYCYATAVVPAGQHAGDGDGELAELRRRFGGWHEPIPALLAAARPAAVLRSDVLELAEPLPSYRRGRVALLGDAAHAMTPDLGQGGCQALEDALTLAAALTAAPSVAAALARYDRARRRRTQALVRRSRWLGRLAHLRNPLAVAARDALLARVTPAANRRWLAPVLDWTPPDPSSTTRGRP